MSGTNDVREESAEEVATPGEAAKSKLYFNREYSWLAFNGRVLEEGLDRSSPLLERVKFLAIHASNLDEYFMIRVSGLRRPFLNSKEKGENIEELKAPTEVLGTIREIILGQLKQHSDCWNDDLMPQLKRNDIHLLHYGELNTQQRTALEQYFQREIFPVLTPLAFDPAHPFPHISNLSLNLAVVVNDPVEGERFARLKVPTDTFPRLLTVPVVEGSEDKTTYVWLEEVISANLGMLFPGIDVAAAYSFRITRDADFEIEEDEADDLLAMVEESVESREFASEVRLEIDANMPEHIRRLLMKNLNIAPYLVYAMDEPIGMADLMQLASLERPELKDEYFSPAQIPSLTMGEDIFSLIDRRNVLLYHPYDSFTPVVDFLRTAARDPNVLAIKQTLYRTGSNSPIVEALLEARDNGKQVAVLVELKARFDEEKNIAWARALEQAGVHVAYGLLGLKIHAKMSLVVRRNEEGIKRYLHVSTGNYNPTTSKIYADLGYFTCDESMGADVSDLFNALTGYSHKVSYKRLLVAPGKMRTDILALIEREIIRQEKHGDGYIALKMNSLVDRLCIDALYRASQAGVKVELQIRGICCLRPGIAGVSENIRVTSIVGRYLEHARIYYFRNGGEDEQVYLGSSDLMPRNLDQRVEILFPIDDARVRKSLKEILQLHLSDNTQARQLQPDGSYERLQPAPGAEAVNSQRWLMEHVGSWE
ncbi:MAG: polyphosphate kinase 1 [bacterium]